MKSRDLCWNLVHIGMYVFLFRHCLDVGVLYSNHLLAEDDEDDNAGHGAQYF